MRWIFSPTGIYCRHAHHPQGCSFPIAKFEIEKVSFKIQRMYFDSKFKDLFESLIKSLWNLTVAEQMKEIGLKRTSDALLAQESAWTNRHIAVIEDSAAPPLNGSIVAVFIKTTPPSVSSKNKDAENPRWDIHLRYRPKPRGAKKQKNTSLGPKQMPSRKQRYLE